MRKNVILCHVTFRGDMILYFISICFSYLLLLLVSCSRGNCIGSKPGRGIYIGTPQIGNKASIGRIETRHIVVRLRKSAADANSNGLTKFKFNP